MNIEELPIHQPTSTTLEAIALLDSTLRRHRSESSIATLDMAQERGFTYYGMLEDEAVIAAAECEQMQRGTDPVTAVWNIATHPNRRREGLGTSLMLHIARVALARGDEFIELYSVNHQFFESLGFTTTQPNTMEMRAHPRTVLEFGAQKQERESSSNRITRRSLLTGISLLAVGGVAGGILSRKLFPGEQNYRPYGELSDADYKRLEQAEGPATERAKELQASINATVNTKTPVDVLVLNDIFLREKIGDTVWRIDRPILLGDPPNMRDLNSGFWFGMQSPEPGRNGQPPSVGVRAVLFDPRRMGLSRYRLPEGNKPLETDRMQLLVMSPDPNMPSDNTVAYAFNEYVPDHRQRRSDNPTQLVAPGRQVLVK